MHEAVAAINEDRSHALFMRLLGMDRCHVGWGRQRSTSLAVAARTDAKRDDASSFIPPARFSGGFEVACMNASNDGKHTA
jgi:hypothetical protein